jgi:hypothetical protein
VYYTKDANLEAGDVVTIDGSISSGVKTSSKNDLPIGIVSTKPGSTIGAGEH